MKPFGRRWLEPRILGALAGLSALLLFAQLAEEVAEGETRSLDERLLLLFRAPGDANDPLGPLWLESFGRDLTALGSIGVLTIVSLATVGFLLLARRGRTAAFVFASTVGGMIASDLLKRLFERARPDIVEHAAYVASTSFPSGHAMLSAAVYLTLGALVARLVRDRRLKLYVMLSAAFLAMAIGVSRVYLGVHWPSDVLAGWIAGALWALLCWALAQALGVAREQRPSQPAED